MEETWIKILRENETRVCSHISCKWTFCGDGDRDGPVPLFGPHSDTKWSEVILKDFVLCQPRRPCPRVPLPPARNSHSYGKGFLSNVGVTRYDDEHAKYEPLHSETSVYFYATAIDRKRAPPLPFPPPHYDEQVQGSLLL